jgi:hypothetical protein
MSYIITCYTLFDITQTNVPNRHRPEVDKEVDEWRYKRNTQSNFDTIQQVISLRSQPELLRKPKKELIRFNEFTEFGFLFEQQDDETYPCWSFDFTVQHPSVFYDGVSELGSLYRDCDGVPVIKCGTEWNKLPTHLDTSDELRNIYRRKPRKKVR